MLGNGNRRRGRARRGAGGASCRSTNRTSCSPPTAPSPSSRRSRSPSSTGSTRASPGTDGFSPSGARTTATPSARCRWATAGFQRRRSPRCASRSCAPPATPTPVGRTQACAMVERHARRSSRRSSSSPSCRAPRACSAADPTTSPRSGGRAPQRGVLLVCDEVATGFGRTGTLFASEQCRLRPDLLCLGKGITGGYLAMSATVASGRVYEAFLDEDLGSRTFFHGHSYGGNALAAAVALRHLALIDEWDVLANVAARAEQLAGLLEDRVLPHPGVGAVRQRGLMVGVELAPPASGLRWGRRVCAGGGGARRAAPPARGRGRPHAAPHDHPTGGRKDRRRPGRRARRGVRCGRRLTRPRGGRPRSRTGGTGSSRATGGAHPALFDACGPEGDLDGAGRRVVSFASNDYLGLGAHPAVVAAAHAALDRWGAGSGASRLVTGTRPVHRDLEEAMAAHTRCEAAVCLPTGFAANLGALSVLGTPGTRIISDELNHASIIDGCRLAKAEVAVYRHGDRGPRRGAARGVRGAGRRGHRHGLLDGRRRRSPGRPRRGMPAARRAAHARRGPRRPRPDPRPRGDRRPDGGPGRHAVEDARIARRRRLGPAFPDRPRRQRGPSLRLHDRAGPGRRPPQPSPLSGCSGPPKGTRSSVDSQRMSGASPRGIPRRSSRSSWARRSGR